MVFRQATRTFLPMHWGTQILVWAAPPVTIETTGELRHTRSCGLFLFIPAPNIASAISICYKRHCVVMLLPLLALITAGLLFLPFHLPGAPSMNHFLKRRPY